MKLVMFQNVILQDCISVTLHNILSVIQLISWLKINISTSRCIFHTLHLWSLLPREIRCCFVSLFLMKVKSLVCQLSCFTAWNE